MDSSGSSDRQEYLQAAFQHPAGLQTARKLVQAVAQHMLRQSTRHTSSITTFSDASPEVESILQDILLFRDSESQTDTGHGGHTAAGTGTGRRANTIDVDLMEGLQGSGPQTNTPKAHARNHSSFSSSTLHSTLETDHFPRSERSLPVSSSHLIVVDKSPESEIRSIFGAKTGGSSILHGTESPYRVESPAVQSSNTPSHLQTHHRSNRDVQAESHGLSRRDTGNRASQLSGPGWNLEPTSRSQAPPPSEAKIYGDIYFAAQQSSEGKSELRATASAITSTGRTPKTLTASSHPLPYAGLKTTIKSFLPVNKLSEPSLSEHNKDNITEGGPHPHNRIASQSKVTSSNATNPSHSGQLHQENLFYSLQSPSPPPNYDTRHSSSPNITNLSSPNLTDTEAEPNDRMASRKRSAEGDGGISKSKRAKVVNPSKKGGKRGAKLKASKSGQEKLPQAIMMRILEFTPPSFLSKARLISKGFKEMVDEFDSIFVNCRRENYGWDMPSPPKGLTERQYSDLFGGKGCLEPGCNDTMSSRTHWSWAKRWCQTCWQSKIIREDRALKQYQGQYARVTLTKLFECIPAGIHDSFLKPHDFNDNLESRSRQAPRLYKYYLITDIPKIISDYEELTPAAFVEDPSLTPDQIASARAGHQILIDGLEEKRNQFFAARKKENDDHMAKVQKIETAIKDKRVENRKPNNENRDARKALFCRRAEEDLPHIPQEFVKSSVHYKAATRIFRDPGSERGWQTLKPKIEKEWADDLRKKAEAPPAAVTAPMEVDQPVVSHEHIPQEPPILRQRSITDFSIFNSFAHNSPLDLGASMKQHHRNGNFTTQQHLMYPNPQYRAQLPMFSNGNYGSHGGYPGIASNTYPNHAIQFQQTMGNNPNGHQPQNTFSIQQQSSVYTSYASSQHADFQDNRIMSISAMLSGPSRTHPNLNYGQP